MKKIAFNFWIWLSGTRLCSMTFGSIENPNLRRFLCVGTKLLLVLGVYALYAFGGESEWALAILDFIESLVQSAQVA